MSGPPHPRPATSSAGIGQFQIGVSPIGSVPPFDVWTTVLSQYANSPIITALITDMGQYFDMAMNFDQFFDYIWNVDTAIGYGLDVWGRIVGVQRVLRLPSGSRYLGFEEAGTTVDPFNQSPFFSGTSLTDNFYLSDSAFRTLILAKAFANISDGSIPSINQLLRTLFPGRGNAYVIDNLDMTMTYYFAFLLTDLEAAIVEQSGVLPKPSGVLANVVQDY